MDRCKFKGLAKSYRGRLSRTESRHESESPNEAWLDGVIVDADDDE